MTVRSIKDRDNPFLPGYWSILVMPVDSQRGSDNTRRRRWTRNPRWRHLSFSANPCLGNIAFLRCSRSRSATGLRTLFFHYCQPPKRALHTSNPLIFEKWSCLQQTDREVVIIHLVARDAKSQSTECRPSLRPANVGFRVPAYPLSNTIDLRQFDT